MMEPGFEGEIREDIPLRDVVFHTLRQAILRGELKPGERLMEIRLANQMGMSRTPIREAIRKLESEGLVRMIPRKGAEVAGITEKNLRDVLEVRGALEGLAVRLTCGKMTREQLENLRNAANEFEVLLQDGDLIKAAKADVRFHAVICHAAGNRKLEQLMSRLGEQTYRFRMEYLRQSASYPRVLEEHEELIRHIERQEREEAERTVRRHIDNQLESVMGILRGESRRMPEKRKDN